jgi:DNA primase
MRKAQFRRVVWWPDRDDHGESLRAARAGAVHLTHSGVRSLFARLPAGLDANDLLRAEGNKVREKVLVTLRSRWLQRLVGQVGHLRATRRRGRGNWNKCIDLSGKACIPLADARRLMRRKLDRHPLVYV